MNFHRTFAGARGFTLVEMLVVIAIIAILATMFYPAIQGALMKARMVDTLNNGKNVFQALLAGELTGKSLFPRSSGTGSFQNSTEYWKSVITNEFVDTTFAVFSAYGLKPYRGLDPNQFTADNNAWCITADQDDATRNVVPGMFTRNLDIARLNDPLSGAVADSAPFGTRGVVVVMRDSSASTRSPAELAETFNPAGATNRVLRP
jgi:prepilin-type N-terminal cleavage/methylation domain-containing protein